MRHRVVLLAAVCCIAAACGCSGPPPALPQSVIAQGIEALPKKHPEVPPEQLERCTDCHRVADAPR